MAIKTRQTTATGVTNNNAPLTNAELDNNFVELQQNKVDASGDTMTGDLSFGDDDKVILGAGSDLQIYHDGDNSYISEVGTGDLYVRGSNFYITKPDGSLYFSGSNSTGEAGVYFNNSRKLATTTDGVDITGEVKADKFVNDAALPEISPSANFDFERGKVLDDRLNFYREGKATYWDGKTQRVSAENELHNSADMTASTWETYGVVITNDTGVTNPSGSTGSNKVTVSLSSQGQSMFRADHVAGGSNWDMRNRPVTFSVYLKEGDLRYVRIGIINYAGTTYYAQAIFDLQTGVFREKQGSGYFHGFKCSMESVGEGWYRCRVTAQWTINSSYNFASNVEIAAATGMDTGGDYGRENLSTTLNGDYFYAWGAQWQWNDELLDYVGTTNSAKVVYSPVMQYAGTNEPRFDHDPLTGESKGLLIEPARTNVLTRSSIGGSTGNTGTTSATLHRPYAYAPDGTFEAAFLRENTAASTTHWLSKTFSISNGNYYVASVYVKRVQGQDRNCTLQIGDSSVTVGVRFDLTNKTATTSLNNPNDAGIEEVGGGWFRIWVRHLATASASNASWQFYLNNGTNIAYTGNGVSGILLWGAQVELGLYPSSYIETDNSQQTRSVEKIIADGEHFPREKGTFLVNVRADDTTDTGGDVILQMYRRMDEIPSSNPVGSLLAEQHIKLDRYTGNYALRVKNGTGKIEVGIDSIGGGEPSVYEYHTIVVAYEDNNWAWGRNGLLATDSTDTEVVQFDAVEVNTDGMFRGHLKRIVFWPDRLSDETLYTLMEDQ